MDNLSGSAILCVEKDPVQAAGLESLVIKNFGNAYVVEIAASPEEALDVMEHLKLMNIETAVVVTDYIFPAMNGMDFIKIINLKYPKAKAILLIGQTSLDFFEEAVNHVQLYRLVRQPYNPTEISVLIKDAVELYQKEAELIRVNKQLKTSEYEKSIILQSIAGELMLIDDNYNILWMSHQLTDGSPSSNDKVKCHEKLYGRKTPCSFCKVNEVLLSKKPVAVEKRFPYGSNRLVNF